jgi:hypothetical protein
MMDYPTLARSLLRDGYRQIHRSSLDMLPALKSLVLNMGLDGLMRDETRRIELLVAAAREKANSGDFEKAARIWEKLAAVHSHGEPLRYNAVAGLLRLFEMDRAYGPARTAAGLKSPALNVMHQLQVISLPRGQSQWIEAHCSRFTDADFWTQQINTAEGTRGAAKLFRQRLSMIAYLIGEHELATAMFKRIQVSKGGAAAAVAMTRTEQDKVWFTPPVTPPSLFMAHDDDTDLAVVCDLIGRASNGLDPRSANIYAAKPLSAHMCAILATPAVWILVKAFQAMQRGDFLTARAILDLELLSHRPLLSALDAKPAIQKIFISGFGKSGSGAVYDAVRGYNGVVEMPGAGPAPHLKQSTATAPMYIQGPHGLGDLHRALSSKRGLTPADIWSFFRIYVLAEQPQTFDEYKAIQATQNLHCSLGPSYFALIMDFVSSLCQHMQARQGELEKRETEVELSADGTTETDAERPVFAAEPFVLFNDRLTKALAPDGTRQMLFYNAISTANTEFMDLFKDASFVAVGRDSRDQFADQQRSNMLFNNSATRFISMMRKNMLDFGEGATSLQETRPDIGIDYVHFEDFVLDGTYRRRLVTRLMGHYDPVAEAAFFNAEHSARNIGIYTLDLSDSDAQTLGASQLRFESTQQPQKAAA